MKVCDLIILGAGPAGITAAVYASRKQLDFLIVTLDIGGQAAWSGDIQNYTGYQFVTGPELTLKFQEHMDSFGIKVNMLQKVTNIIREKEYVKITADKQQYLAKTAIVATGKRSRELGVPGEQEFKNRGVTYCATCDGPLFKNKSVAVIGGGNSGLDAALQMVKISPKVYIVDINPELKADPVMVKKIQQSSNVEVWNNTKVSKIYGQTFVKGIEVLRDSKPYNLEVAGVFVEIGLIPNSEFASALERNQWQEIVVDCYNRTNIKGVFAAGDVTNVPEKQIIIACGEGSKACLSAFKYLATHTWKE